MQLEHIVKDHNVRNVSIIITFYFFSTISVMLAWLCGMSLKGFQIFKLIFFAIIKVVEMSNELITVSLSIWHHFDFY